MSGISGIQRVEMPSIENKPERSATSAKEKVTKDETAAIGAASQKEGKAKYDLDLLSDKDKKKLEEELKKTNDSLSSSGKMLKFKFNEEAKTMYVEVIDSESQEVIASLPPEFLIDLSLKMKELIGMFFDERR
jgi:Uncharacterized flagellar protein FlaG